jgi:hypothetical protein
VKGYVVLAKSATPSRIASNLTGAVSAAGKLDKDDIAVLDGLAASGKQKRSVTLLSRAYQYIWTLLFAVFCRFITPPWRTYTRILAENLFFLTLFHDF